MRLRKERIKQKPVLKTLFHFRERSNGLFYKETYTGFLTPFFHENLSERFLEKNTSD